MTRHRCGLWLVVVGMCLSGSLALGQGVARIPADVRTATSLTSAQQQLISTAISDEIAALQRDDAAAQQQARDALIDAVRDRGELINSSVYKRHFATALNQAVVALPDKASLRTRLNAAIATARVAQLSKNSQLSRAARKFMGDEDMPVALWGVKAARWILPYEAANALFSANNELLRAIPAAATAHEAGAMIEEAYDALSLLLNDPNVPKPPAESLRIVVPIVQELISQRLALHAEGEAQQPLAETRGVNFLAHPEVYRAQAAADRLRTAQLISELLSVAAGRAVAGDGDRGTYIQMVRDLGGAVSVVGLHENNPGIQAAGRAVTQIQNNSTSNEVEAVVSATFKALKAAPTFNNLKLPPAAAPATNGGSQSDTVNSVAGSR